MKKFFFLMLLAIPSVWAEVVVIVNQSNPVAELERSLVSDFFLKKRKQWGDGTPSRFFDREDGTAERNEFLREVVGKSARDVELFWIGEKLYTGHTAPSQVASDTLVVSLVARFPGAIGYLRAPPPKDKGVKAVGLKGH